MHFVNCSCLPKKKIIKDNQNWKCSLLNRKINLNYATGNELDEPKLGIMIFLILSILLVFIVSLV